MRKTAFALIAATAVVALLLLRGGSNPSADAPSGDPAPSSPGAARHSASGYVPRSNRALLERDGAQVMELRLTPASRITGHVVLEEDGEPVPFASVSAERAGTTWNRARQQTRADAEGRFAFDDLATGEYLLSARKGALAGQRPAAVTVEYLGRVSDIRVELRAARTISGLVRGSDGRPVGGAQVLLRDHEREERAGLDPAETAADGSFRLQGLWPGRYVLFVSAEGFAPQAGSPFLVRDGDVTGLEVVLQNGATVHGRVLAGDGSPAAGSTVRARVRDPDRSASMPAGGASSAVADVEGNYRLADLPPGEVALTAEHEYAGRADATPFALEAGEMRQFDLRLRPGATVGGTVRWQDGAAAAGVYVTADAPRSKRETTTDEDGRYRFGSLRAGIYQVRARPSASRFHVFLEDPSERRVEVAAGRVVEEVDLVLPRADRGIEGTVVSASYAPVADAEVTAGRISVFTEDGARARTGPDGSFRITGLTSGDDYVVTATHPGFAPGSVEGVSAGARGVAVTLSAAAVVSGRVVEENGAPVRDYTVLAHRKNGDGRDPARDVHDTAGRFELGGLAAGTWIVVASTADGRSGRADDMTLASGERRDGLEIVMARGTEIRGRVVAFEGGAPVPDAQVIGAAGTARLVRNTRTAEDGSFLFEGVPYGTSDLILSVYGDRARTAPESYSITPGTERVLDLGVLRLLPPGKRVPHGVPTTGVEPAWTLDGAVVRGVKFGSSAEEHGIAEGDRIVAVGGRDVAGVGSVGLQRLLDGGPEGSTVEVTVRGGSGGSRTVHLVRRSSW